MKKIAVLAAVIASAAVLSTAGSFSALAAPQGEPTASVSSASRVLRDYPMPGDPHDAVASFNELVGEVGGTSQVDIVSAVIRNFPMPGDPHDAGYSLAELVKSVGNGSIVIREPQRSIVPATIVPMPGDPHDAQLQLQELWNSFQPETPSRIRLSD